MNLIHLQSTIMKKIILNLKVMSRRTRDERARVRTNSETDESDHSVPLYVENESNQKRILLEERFLGKNCKKYIIYSI